MDRKLLINPEIEQKISNFKNQIRRLSQRNQSTERKNAIGLTNSFIDDLRPITSDWDQHLTVLFEQNPNDNLYYLREEYLKDLVITKMVIEDSNLLTLKELEIDL